MTSALRLLGLDPDRWKRVGPGSIWVASAVAVVAWSLLSLNRFGGLAFTEPRAFLRLVTVGIWGWLGLAVAIWALSEVLVAADQGEGERSAAARLIHTIAAVGYAQAPLMVVAVVVFIAANVLRLFGPGWVVAAFVVTAWVPAMLIVGSRPVFGFGFGRAIAAVVLPYLGWAAVVGRYALDQVQHLL